MKFIDYDAHENIGNLVPAENEILLDKKNRNIVIGDGSTPGGVKNTTIPGVYRSQESNYRRYFPMPVDSANPGNSGATFVAPGANSIGGWKLDAASEVLYMEADVFSDWDGKSDLNFSVSFEVNTNNTAGTATDTVDIKAVCYYKGAEEVVTKTQTVEVATVVGASPQYKMFDVCFTIDWDKTSNVVQVGDKFHIILNLETDTSEVDDIVIAAGSASFCYATTHVGVENTDV